MLLLWKVHTSLVNVRLLPSLFLVEETLDHDGDYDVATKQFQKDNWRFKFLPYYDELINEANREFELLKTAIAGSILRRDIRPGFIYAVHDLIE